MTAALLAAATAARAAESPGVHEQDWNPYLAAGSYAVAGINSARTGVIGSPISPGTFKVDLRKASRVRQGPINATTLASPSPNFMWAVSSRRVAYAELKLTAILEVSALDLGAPIAAAGLERLVQQSIPGLPQIEEALRREWGDRAAWPSPAEGGSCALVDITNVLYVNAGPGGGTLLAIGLQNPASPGQGLKVLRKLDLSKVLGPQAKSGEPAAPAGIQAPVALSMTYDGHLVVVGRRSLAVIERSLAGQSHAVFFGDDETVSKGVAVDPKGGIYVVSDKLMRKLVWNGYRLSEKQSEGAWSAPYDTGRQPPAGKAGTGSGSAPSLMGFGGDKDKLVLITDGADRMKLVAFWRDQIPKGFKERPWANSLRIAGQIQVSCGFEPAPAFLQSDQSVVVRGLGAFVVNTVRARGADQGLVDVMATGPVFDAATGAERFEWDPVYGQWHSVWTRSDIVVTGAGPALSAPSGTVLVPGYTKKEGWELTGMDWDTGRTVHRSLFGPDPLGNGSFATIHLLAKDDLLLDGLGGPIRPQLLPPKK